MSSQITSALSNGFTPEQIIEYIFKKFPAHKKKIEKALSGGFTASQILTYLSKQSVGKESLEQPTTEYGQLRSQDIQGQESRARTALAAGSLAATSLAAPIAASALQRALPNSLQSLVPSLTAQTIGSNLGTVEQPTQQQNQPQQPPISNNVPSVTQPEQPAQAKGIINPKEYLDKLGVTEKVNELLNAGNTPESIAAALSMKRGPGRLKAEIDPELMQAIDEYSKIQEKKSPENKEDPRFFGRIEDLGEKKLFHQTTKKAREGIEKEGFRLGEGEKLDIELPSGVYLKPSDVKINLPGEEQIEVSTQLGKTAHFKDRKDFVKYLRKNDKNYDKIYQRFLDKDKELNDYLTFVDKNPDVEIDDEKIDKLEKEIETLAKVGRKASTDYFKDNGIATLHIQRDSGGSNLPGGATETYISLNEKKVNPISKGDTIASSKGIGEVKEIRNGQALIDVDGKLHKVNEEELEAEPEEVREAKFGFDPSTVPEELRSAPLNEVYLPHDRRHVTVKYNAGLKPIRYIYFRKDEKNIPTDYINKIMEGLQLPVSSGKSFWGAWSADESDSRGAANYQELVANSQEEGEPDDPSKAYWFIKEEALYEHPYMEKAGKEELRRMEKEFNEANKKPRKPKKKRP